MGHLRSPVYAKRQDHNQRYDEPRVEVEGGNTSKNLHCNKVDNREAA